MSMTGKNILDKNIPLTNTSQSYSLGSPILMDEFGWSEADATFYWSIMMSASGIIGFFSYIILGKLTKKYGEI